MKKFKYSSYESQISYSASNVIVNSKKSTKDFKKFLASLAVTASLTYGVPRVYSATITVDSLEDNTTTDGYCNLREAIVNANDDNNTYADCTAGDGDDTINMSTLSGTINIVNGDLNISDSDNTTTIIGNYSNLKLDGNKSSRIFRVKYSSNDANFQNLYIQNGYSSGSGGCLDLWKGNFTIENSTITDCNSTGNDGGGGVFFYGSNPTSHSLTITSSTIKNNYSAKSGGGVQFYNEDSSAKDVVVTISDSNITNNRAGSGFNASTNVAGGGISAHHYGKLNISNSIISGNITEDEGGGIFSEYADVNISNSIISNNTGSEGGGICLESSNSNYYDLNITNSTITGNDSKTGGGGIYVEFGDLYIKDSNITGNISESDDGGGVYMWATTSTKIVSSIIKNNKTLSGDGGGFSIKKDEGNVGSLEINSSIISDNNSSASGGGVYFGYTDDLSVNIVNSTISGNTALGCGGGVFLMKKTSLSVQGTKITENNASGEVACTGGYFNVRGGGGIALAYGSTLDVNRTHISGNIGYRGAGIYAGFTTGKYFESVTIAESNITNNGSETNTTVGGISISLANSESNIIDSTISGNIATKGDSKAGAIFSMTSAGLNIKNSTISGHIHSTYTISNMSKMTILNSTIASNDGNVTFGTIATSTNLYNTIIVDNNTISTDIYCIGGGLSHESSNIVESQTGCSNNDFNTTNPSLGSLSNNGGPTFTHAITSSSSAYNRGDNEKASEGGLSTDQRGESRIKGDNVDIGAYEADSVLAISVSANLWQMVSVPKGVTLNTSTITSQLATSTSVWAYRNESFVQNPTTNPKEGLWLKPNSTSINLSSASEDTSYDYTNKDAQMYGWKCEESLSPNEWHLVSVQHDMSWSDFTRENITPDNGCVYTIIFNYDHEHDSWNSTDTIPANSALWLQHICTSTPSCDNNVNGR